MKKYWYSTTNHGDESGFDCYRASEVDARIEELHLQLIEQGGELGKCQENRDKNLQTIKRYEARIAELERELAVRKAAIEAQFRLMERVRELEEALQAMPCACGSWLRAGLSKCPRCTALGL